MEITAIGLDLAKRVFQAHGVNVSGKAVLRRKRQRSKVLAFFNGLAPCLVGIEARGTAHGWAREIRALGHEVWLMPASYVKPCVKRGKTDAAYAIAQRSVSEGAASGAGRGAICEAATRPILRFVPVRQRTTLVNALAGTSHQEVRRNVAPQGISRVEDLGPRSWVWHDPARPHAAPSGRKRPSASQSDRQAMAAARP